MDDECTERHTIARVITSYWRPTRGVIEASAFLAYFQDGGSYKIRVEWSPSWANEHLETEFSIRLSNRGKGVRPVAIESLWKGGTFDAAYNDDKLPVDFDADADAEKIELWTIVTGHGMSDTGNCAEFCNHNHEYTINGGETYMIEYDPVANNTDSYVCAKMTGQGVQPNQWGTWYFGRAGWCPGWVIQPWSADITESLTLGESNTLEYRGWWAQEDAGPGGSISKESYAVTWK